MEDKTFKLTYFVVAESVEDVYSAFDAGYEAITEHSLSTDGILSEERVVGNRFEERV